VNGRNTITWEQKFACDVWYVEHCSFLLDFSILLRTFRVVVFRQGVNASENTTMPDFLGTPAFKPEEGSSSSEDDPLHAVRTESSPALAAHWQGAQAQ
jgi:hypothetical protein